MQKVKVLQEYYGYSGEDLATKIEKRINDLTAKGWRLFSFQYGMPAFEDVVETYTAVMVKD